MSTLSGLLVIAIEQAVAAPLCTQRLADAGARVIKVERAEGETARHYDKAVHGQSAYFVWLNRGKESSVFNLKDLDDVAVVRKMILNADVLVQNLAPGALARLGLGIDDLRAENTRLIAVSIIGYGQDTNYADRRAYDLLVQAESGVVAMTGGPDTPSKVGVSVADIATGMTAHTAVLEALIERGITGQGRTIDGSMFDYRGHETPRAGLNHAIIAPYGPVTCSDGDIIVVVQNPEEWKRFCSDVLGDSGLETDPRFVDNPSRVENRDALGAIMAVVFAKLTRAEAAAKLQRASLAVGQISSIVDVSKHPALRRVSGLVGQSSYQIAAPPLHLDMGEKPVPELGEHTAAIRQEFT
jgi:itaconate CoA-transferase